LQVGCNGFCRLGQQFGKMRFQSRFCKK
jgi:hypothetical protein